MNILHCITGLSGDGAQRMLLRLVRGLEKDGMRNVVVSLGDRGALAPEFEASGVPVRALRMSGAASFVSGLLALRTVVREFAPDIIQGWMYHANLLAIFVREARGSRLPVLWNVRRGLDDLGERKRATHALVRGSAWLSSRASRIIYCSQRSREQHEAAGFSGHAPVVLGNGFDTDLFAPNAGHRARFRQELGLDENGVLIGNVGRFDVAKGHRILVEAFCDIAARHPAVHLACVGRGLEAQLVPSGVPLAIGKRIHLLPERDRVHEVFPAFDIYCSSSIAEGFPNVIAEALSTALPVVATDTGATRELVGSRGILVQPRSVAAIVAGLEELLRELPDSRRCRGEEGRNFILKEHSLARVVGLYRELYEGELTAFGVPKVVSARRASGLFF